MARRRPIRPDQHDWRSGASPRKGVIEGQILEPLRHSVIAIEMAGEATGEQDRLVR